MVNVANKSPTIKYYNRFGEIAVDMGFVTAEKLKDALNEQTSNEPSNRLRLHRYIGEIFFEKGWINHKQIEIILNELCRYERKSK